MAVLRRLVYQLRRRWADRHYKTCPKCKGSGIIQYVGFDYIQIETCPKCGMTGLVRK